MDYTRGRLLPVLPQIGINVVYKFLSEETRGQFLRICCLKFAHPSPLGGSSIPFHGLVDVGKSVLAPTTAQLELLVIVCPGLRVLYSFVEVLPCDVKQLAIVRQACDRVVLLHRFISEQ
jgi:hypothetical protein